MVLTIVIVLSASVSAFASSAGLIFVDWQIVDTILNLQTSSQNCTIVKYYTNTPTPSMTDSSGTNMTQKTTYNVMVDMYETVTVKGASWLDNTLAYGQFEWYQYGGYCWIKYTTDNLNNVCWVANYQGKILYCDAPEEETTYDVVGIAGASNYYQTNRPAGTTGNGYLGDLQVTYNEWMNIKNELDSISGTRFYYAMGHSINGQYRYYMTSSGMSDTYYVCNSAGQLYYYLKDEGGSGGSGGGADFDATEIITAINSVYDAIEYGFYDVCDWLDGIQDDIRSLNTDVILLSQNMVSGFSDLANIGNNIVGKLATLDTRLIYVGANVVNSVDTGTNNVVNSVDTFRTLFNDYFYSLGKKYPQLMTVRLSGNDNLFDWDSGDIIKDVRSSSTDGDVSIRKAYTGDYGNIDVDLSSAVNNGFAISTSSNGYHSIHCAYSLETIPVSLFTKNGYYTWSNGAFVEDSRYKCTDLIFLTKDAYFRGFYDGSCYISCYSADKVFLGNKYNYTDVPDGTVYIAYTWKVVEVSSVPFFRSLCNCQLQAMPESLFTLNGAYSFYEGVFIQSTSHKCTDIIPLDQSAYIFGYYDGNSYISCYSADKTYLGNKYYNTSFPDGTYYIAYTWGFVNQPSIGFYGLKDFDPCRPVFNYLGEEHALSVTLSHGIVDCDDIYYNVSSSQWMIYRWETNSSSVLPDVDQQILNEVSNIAPSAVTVPVSQFVTSSISSFFSQGVNHISVTDDTVIFVDYYHNGTWFDYVSSYLDYIYVRLGEASDIIVNIENTIVDISPDNDAYNIFYIEKEDGSKESIGDAALDTTKFIGNVLSMFYRLVFDDALDNIDLLDDFEGAFSNEEVTVW